MTVQELIYKNQVLKIEQDLDPMSPREFDNTGIMVCGNSHYTLGDKQINDQSPEEYFTDLGLSQKDIILLPLYIMDHSGLSMSTGDYNDKWDSGLVGFIYTTKQKVKDEWNVKRISKKLHDRIINRLKSEVNVYSDYIEGNVYGFTLTENVQTENGLVEIDSDSCWGFYGNDPQKNGISDNIHDFDKFVEI